MCFLLIVLFLIVCSLAVKEVVILMVGLSGCSYNCFLLGRSGGLLGLETLEGTALCVLYPVLPHWFPFADLGNDMEFFLKKCDCW